MILLQNFRGILLETDGVGALFIIRPDWHRCRSDLDSAGQLSDGQLEHGYDRSEQWHILGTHAVQVTCVGLDCLDYK